MEILKKKALSLVRWSEKYTKTDMVYLLRGSFWMNLNTIVVSIFSIILSISFARYVSKDIYGVYQFLISIASILGALTLTGMNSAITQAVARNLEGVFTRAIKTQLKFGAIPLFAGVAASIYYLINDNTTLAVSIFIIAITLPLINTFNTWSAFVYGKKDFKYLFVFNQVINLFSYGGLIVTLLFFPSVIWLVLIGFMLNTVSNYLVYLIVRYKYKPNDIDEEEAISYGKKLSLSNILPTVGLHIDNIIIFHFLGPVQLAIYAFASNIPERLSSFIKPISQVAFPKLSTQTKDEVSFAMPQKILRLFMLSLVAGGFYFILAPLLFKIFFPQYMSSVIYSQVYVIAILFSVTASLPTTSLYATRSKSIYSLNTIHPLVSISSILIGVYYFGLWGVIYAKIGSALFLLIYSYILVRRNP